MSGLSRALVVTRAVVASAMVLCAGYGTRLRSLTDELPKPLVPVGDRPLLAHIADRVAICGFERYVINVHHLPGRFASVLNNLPVRVHVELEPEIRGTAGGVAGARRVLEPPVLVWNGDILADPPVTQLVREADQHGIALAVSPQPQGQGTVGVGAAGQIVRLRGKSYGSEVGGADYIGVCALGASVLAALPHRGCLIGDCIVPALERGAFIPTCSISGRWDDLGSPARYHALNMRWLEARGVDHYVAPDARVAAEVTVPGSIIGASARVGGEGRVENCVVWPGASVTAPLANAIVTAGGVVVAIDS